MQLNKLANQATPEKPTVAFQVVEHEAHYAVMIPKSVAIGAIRETVEKGIPFFVGLPVTGSPGGAILNLNVTEGDAHETVRFRLGSMNLFVAKK